MMNRDFLIKKITNAINVYPSIINLKREKRSDDGMGGYTVDSVEDIATFKAFFESSKSSVSLSVSEGGRVTKVSNITLTVPFSDEFVLKKGDFFNLNGTEYRITNPNPQLNICYIAELEVL